jgi:hypothetical protein
VGSAQPVERQRGFTLLDVAVACAVVAILAVAAVAIGQAIRPSALRAALDGYDASLAAARALASSGGDGATLVFTPRFGPAGARLPGFLLRVYAGRPNDPARMHPGSSLPVIARADVTSPSLGTPPFSIFVNASGHASGRAGYPALAADGTPRFSTITREPPCAGEIVLRFRTPTAEETRMIACSGSLADAVGSTPLPNASPTPEAPLLTPSRLVFFWPAAPRAHIVATEWGYTRWFAVPDGFACAASGGSTIAAFPRTAPAPPYSPPHDDAAALATPPPPADVPYSYPNAPDSMEDAPAWFYLDPVAPGLCTLRVTDAYGQSTSAPVRVMGWLTLSSGTAHADASPGGGLLLVPQVLGGTGSSASVAITKAFDDVPAQTFPAGRRAVTICSATTGAPCNVDCTPFLDAQVEDVASAGSQPDLTARLVVQVVGNGNRTGSRVTCRGSVTDALGEPPVHFAVVIDPAGDAAGTLPVWPARIVLLQAGGIPVVVQTANLPGSPAGAQPIFSQLITTCTMLALNPDGTVATQQGAFVLPDGKTYAVDPQSGCVIPWNTTENFWSYSYAMYPNGAWQSSSTAPSGVNPLAVTQDSTPEFQEVKPPSCSSGSIYQSAQYPSTFVQTQSLEAQWALPGSNDSFWNGASCTVTFTAGSSVGALQKSGTAIVESFPPCPLADQNNPPEPAGYICRAVVLDPNSGYGDYFASKLQVTESGVRIYIPIDPYLSGQYIPGLSLYALVYSVAFSPLDIGFSSQPGAAIYFVKTTSTKVHVWDVSVYSPSAPHPISVELSF